MKLSEFISKYGDCEVTEEMKKFIEKPKGKWMPRYGEEYWYVNNSTGFIYRDDYYDTEFDKYKRNFSRIFKTKEEAERYLEIMKACKEASFEPDWKDHKQGKHYLFYCYFEKRLKISQIYGSTSGEPFIFESYEKARDLITRFGEKDIAKYVLGVEVE